MSTAKVIIPAKTGEEITVDLGGGDKGQCMLLSAGAMDCPPLPGDRVAIIGDPEDEDVAASPSLESSLGAMPGEIFFGARALATLMSFMKMKLDGSISFGNDFASIEIGAGPLGGLTITAGGATIEINPVLNDVIINGVPFGLHYHATGVGPSGPPIPGPPPPPDPTEDP